MRIFYRRHFGSPELHLRHRRRQYALLVRVSPSVAAWLRAQGGPSRSLHWLADRVAHFLERYLFVRCIAQPTHLSMGKKYEHSHFAAGARTGAGKRAIEARLPKTIENAKQLLALKGHSTSAVCTAVLNEIHTLKKPFCKKLQRKNDILPFESGGEAHLENLARLNDCSLFALVNHTKKRPHNLVLGRIFNSRILDMFEFGITNYAPFAAFPTLKSAPGSKPLVLFNGDDFEVSHTTRTIRSLLIDMFRGADDGKMLNLAGIDRVIVFTLRAESVVMFRHYAIILKKSGDSRLPKVELIEAGPKFDLTLRRAQCAPDSLLKEAMRKPKDPAAVRKIKNISRDDMGDKKGRVHVGRQDLSGLALAKMKGLERKRSFKAIETDTEDADDPSSTLQKGGAPIIDSPSPKRLKS